MRSGGGATCDGGRSPEIQHEREALRSPGDVSGLHVVIGKTNLSAKLREETRRTPEAYRTVHAQLPGPKRISALFPQMAVLTNDIVFGFGFLSWLLDSSVAGCEQVTSMCIELHCT